MQFIITSLMSSLTAPLFFGYTRYVINLVRDEETSIKVIFNYFQYFLTIFIIAICFNLVTNFTIILEDLDIAFLGSIYSIFALLVMLVYTSVQNMFALHPEKKSFETIKDAFTKFKTHVGRYICLQLSYYWQFFVILFIYMSASIMTTSFEIFTDVESIIGNEREFEMISAMFSNQIPFLVVTGLFLIAVIAYAIIIIPKLLFSTAKFFLIIFGEDVKTNNEPSFVQREQPQLNNQQINSNPTQEKKFCPNCGNQVNSNFCTNCGNKM